MKITTGGVTIGKLAVAVLVGLTLNTGHGGSLATVHANSATAALSRLATCAMQASDALPWTVVCRGVSDGIAAVIHQTRTPEGTRRVAQMVRVIDYDAQENRWRVESIWPAPATPDTGEIDPAPVTAASRTHGDEARGSGRDEHTQAQEGEPCTNGTTRT